MSRRVLHGAPIGVVFDGRGLPLFVGIGFRLCGIVIPNFWPDGNLPSSGFNPPGDDKRSSDRGPPRENPPSA